MLSRFNSPFKSSRIVTFRTYADLVPEKVPSVSEMGHNPATFSKVVLHDLNRVRMHSSRIVSAAHLTTRLDEFASLEVQMLLR